MQTYSTNVHLTGWQAWLGILGFLLILLIPVAIVVGVVILVVKLVRKSKNAAPDQSQAAYTQPMTPTSAQPIIQAGPPPAPTPGVPPSASLPVAPIAPNPSLPSRFYIEQDYKLVRESFHVTDGTNLVCVADMKTFAIKASIQVFRDEAKTQPAFQIQQANMVGTTKTYDIADAAGQKMGAFRLQSLQSIMNEHWEILDAAGTPIGTIEQDTAKALMGRFLPIVPQTFVATVAGHPACTYTEEVNIGVRFKMNIDFSADAAGSFDRTLGIAGAILLASRHNETQ